MLVVIGVNAVTVCLSFRLLGFDGCDFVLRVCLLIDLFRILLCCCDSLI